MGGTASFCIGVRGMPSSYKTGSFRGNSIENSKWLINSQNMRYSPLRTLQTVHNRRYQEVKISE